MFLLKITWGVFFKPLNVFGRYFYGGMTLCAYNVLCDHFLMLFMVVVHSFLLSYIWLCDGHLCIYYCALFILLVHISFILLVQLHILAAWKYLISKWTMMFKVVLTYKSIALQKVWSIKCLWVCAAYRTFQSSALDCWYFLVIGGDTHLFLAVFLASLVKFFT